MQRVGPAYAAITEGALSYEPPPKDMRFSFPTGAPKQKPKPRKPGGGALGHLLAVPGFREFLSRDALHQIRRCGHKRCRRPGSYLGFSPEENKIIKMKAEKKAMKDYDKLFGSVNEDDPIAEYAIKKILALLNEPIGVKDAHALLRTLLEYRKAKPAQISKVTVEQTQDNWVELLETHNLDDDKLN